MNLYNIGLADFKKNFIMYVPLSIILQSCLGSISIFYLTQLPYTMSTFLGVTICTIVCMLYNASIMAQLKHKWIFNFLILSIVVNILLLLVYRI
nr:hypothetical protein [uncultured Psychroserpens sp.]